MTPSGPMTDATTVEKLSRRFEDVADRWNNRNRRFADSGLRIGSVNARLVGSALRLILYNYGYPGRFPYICRYIQANCNTVLITSRHARASNLGKVIQVAGISDNNGLQLLLHRT